MNWLINKLIAFAKRRPYLHLPGYMERYWLVRGKQDEGANAVRLHHILRSDLDRHFHDHPWNYISVILRGGYLEVTPVFNGGLYVGELRRWRGPGSILFRRAEHWHRLELPKGTTTWTLFITGPKRQNWGFLTTPDFKTYYRSYIPQGSEW